MVLIWKEKREIVIKIVMRTVEFKLKDEVSRDN